ncbi:MAG: hypothetical protein GKR97_08530 [Rhizobiaceae bacterium]|nr:hypothetical protein [Rhizobiaceae bacterium]
MLLILQIAIIMGAVGAAIAFFGLIAIATLFGASNMEGGLAMGAVGFAPIGALVGAIIGLWLAWRLTKIMNAGAVLVGGYGLAVLVLASIGAWFAYEELTDGDPYLVENEPVMHIEWRLPEKVRPDRVDRTFRFTMRSSYMDWTLSTKWDEPRVRVADGVSILRMRAWIRWRVGGRIFQLWRAPHHDDRITVEPELPRDPGHQDEYGPWQTVPDHSGYAFRTRIVRNDRR